MGSRPVRVITQAGTPSKPTTHTGLHGRRWSMKFIRSKVHDGSGLEYIQDSVRGTSVHVRMHVIELKLGVGVQIPVYARRDVVQAPKDKRIVVEFGMGITQSQLPRAKAAI